MGRCLGLSTPVLLLDDSVQPKFQWLLVMRAFLSVAHLSSAWARRPIGEKCSPGFQSSRAWNSNNLNPLPPAPEELREQPIPWPQREGGSWISSFRSNNYFSAIGLPLLRVLIASWTRLWSSGPGWRSLCTFPASHPAHTWPTLKKAGSKHERTKKKSRSSARTCRVLRGTGCPLCVPVQGLARCRPCVVSSLMADDSDARARPRAHRASACRPGGHFTAYEGAARADRLSPGLDAQLSARVPLSRVYQIKKLTSLPNTLDFHHAGNACCLCGSGHSLSVWCGSCLCSIHMAFLFGSEELESFFYELQIIPKSTEYNVQGPSVQNTTRRGLRNSPFCLPPSSSLPRGNHMHG